MHPTSTLSAIFGFIICFAIDVCNTVPERDFGYYGMKGPQYWADELHYGTCAGKLQSPINIEEHALSPIRFPPLDFRGFHSFPKSCLMTNNGHTVTVELESKEFAIVSGGPLSGKYVFSQLHFHWGANDSFGSEDRINNHSFPMELHALFYKLEYGDTKTAMRHKDGLAVFAVFYEASDYENQVYAEIIQHLAKVRQPHSKVRLHSPLTLDSLLPSNKYHYYTYNGSLTTPPCYEVVIWLDFKEPIFLSHEQIAAFRKLRSPDGELVQNFRPVQPLEGRVVYYNVGERPIEFQSSAFGDEHRSTGSSTSISTALVCLISVLSGIR